MYVSVSQAAERLGVSAHTIRQWTTGGALPSIRTVGGHRRIAAESVIDLYKMLEGARRIGRTAQNVIDAVMLPDSISAEDRELADIISRETKIRKGKHGRVKNSNAGR